MGAQGWSSLGAGLPLGDVARCTGEVGDHRAHVPS